MGLYHKQKEQMITNAKKFYKCRLSAACLKSLKQLRLLDLQLMSDLVYVLFIALFVYSISNSHNDLSRNSSGKYLYDLSKSFGWGFFLRGMFEWYADTYQCSNCKVLISSDSTFNVTLAFGSDTGIDSEQY